MKVKERGGIYYEKKQAVYQPAGGNGGDVLHRGGILRRWLIKKERNPA